jgi:hypothetical protein
MNGNGNAKDPAGGNAVCGGSPFPGCRCGRGLGRRGYGGRGWKLLAGLSLGRADAGLGQGADPTVREASVAPEGKAAPLPGSPANEEIGTPLGRFGRGRCGRGLGLRGIFPLLEEPAGDTPGGADPAPERDPA